MSRGEFVLPEQHFGPLVAAQVPPGLVALNGRGGTLGNVVLRGAHCAAQVTAFRISQGATLSVCRTDKLAIDEQAQRTGMVVQPGLCSGSAGSCCWSVLHALKNIVHCLGGATSHNSYKSVRIEVSLALGIRFLGLRLV